MVKLLVQPGAVRAPGGRVLVDGTELPGLIEAEVTSNGHYQADRFRLQMALNAEGGKDAIWWGSNDRVGVLFDVRVSLDGDERSLMLGEADSIRIRLSTGLVEIEGRDLTSRLIDNQVQEAFLNKTSSEIATELANRRGLTPVVTATSSPVSRFYKGDHDRVSHDQFSKTSTEWDLLTYLAQHEGFDVYIKPGTKELHFEKAVDPSKAEPYAIVWHPNPAASDVTRLELDRSLTLAKDVVVVVRSWHSKKGREFSRSSPKGAASSSVRSGKAQRYVFTIPDLMEDEAQKRADFLRAEITKHERKISFDCPGELNLSPRDIISLTGVGGWDQTYYVDNITRRLGFEAGFIQTVTAKNHNVESQAQVG